VRGRAQAAGGWGVGLEWGMNSGWLEGGVEGGVLVGESASGRSGRIGGWENAVETVWLRV
jgi:hypothetical protein